MKSLIYFLVLSIYLPVLSQKKVTNSQAINIISKQAMLSQRMAKDKVYILNRVNGVSNISLELNSSIILFEKNIKTLGSIKLPSNVHKKINTLELLWTGYKENITKSIAKENIKTIVYSDIILEQCNTIYNEILKSSKQENTYPYGSNNDLFIDAVINNNDLKYLSQKLAFYYTSYFYKVNKYKHEEFDKIINDIDFKIKTCSKIKMLNLEIAEKTDELEYDWRLIKEKLTLVLSNKFVSTHSSPTPAFVFENCNKILKDVDQLSRTYKASNDLR